LKQGAFARLEAAAASTDRNNPPPEAASRSRTRFSSGCRFSGDHP
jgi:hypothetical protein